MSSENWANASLKQLVEGFVISGKSIREPWFGSMDVEIYNTAVRRMSVIAKAMRALGAQGDQALIALMDHKNVAVRGRAAAACRDFARDQAINVLADICDLRVGQMSMDAMHALFAIDAFDMKTGPIRPRR